MKGIEFLKKVSEPLGITLPEDVTAKLTEVELPDEIGTKFSEMFISKERAKNDTEIIEHIVKEDRKNHFRIVDKKIEEAFLPLVGADQAQVIKNTFESYKKMDMLATAVSDAIKGAKGKVSEDVQKVENEWAEKVRAEKEQHKKEIESLHVQNKENQFHWIVSSKVNGYSLAEQFQDKKDSIKDLAILDLKKKGHVYEIENGTVTIMKEENGVKRHVFEPGTENKLTLEKLLDTFIDPFVAKSNGGKKKEDEPTSGGNPQPKQKTIGDGGMSHIDRMRERAAM
jgi:hypothetical protein